MDCAIDEQIRGNFCFQINFYSKHFRFVNVCVCVLFVQLININEIEFVLFGNRNNNNTSSNNNNNVDQSNPSSDRDTALSSLASSSNSSSTSTSSSSTSSGTTSAPTAIAEEMAQSTSVATDAENSSSAPSDVTHSSSDEITIKLKYLNDDLKIVKARTSEPIGDFKKYEYSYNCYIV